MAYDTWETISNTYSLVGGGAQKRYLISSGNNKDISTGSPTSYSFSGAAASIVYCSQLGECGEYLSDLKFGIMYDSSGTNYNEAFKHYSFSSQSYPLNDTFFIGDGTGVYASHNHIKSYFPQGPSAYGSGVSSNGGISCECGCAYTYNMNEWVNLTGKNGHQYFSITCDGVSNNDAYRISMTVTSGKSYTIKMHILGGTGAEVSINNSSSNVYIGNITSLYGSGGENTKTYTYNATSSGTIYVNLIINNASSAYYSYSSSSQSTISCLSADVEIYETNLKTITLNRNYGVSVSKQRIQTSLYNSTPSSVQVPSRSGFTFLGYYDTSSVTGGTQYFSSSGSATRTWNKNYDSTLYARWKPTCSYSLTNDPIVIYCTNNPEICTSVESVIAKQISNGATYVVPSCTITMTRETSSYDMTGITLSSDGRYIYVDNTATTGTRWVLFNYSIPAGSTYTSASGGLLGEAIELKVLPNNVESLSISVNKNPIDVNETTKLITNATFSNGTTADCSNLADFSMGTQNIIHISQTLTNIIFDLGSSTVEFAPGNLQAYGLNATGDSYIWTADSWGFANKQYISYGDGYDANNGSFVGGGNTDLFTWVGNSATYNSYGLCTNQDYNNDYYGTVELENLKSDWGQIPDIVNKYGSGWRTPTIDEWTYLLAHYQAVFVDIFLGAGKAFGLLIFPSGVSPTQFGIPTSKIITATSNNQYEVPEIHQIGYSDGDGYSIYNQLESAGCLFLPTTGYRDGATATSTFKIDNLCSDGYYWSSTVTGIKHAYRLAFDNGSAGTTKYQSRRHYGRAVRLIRNI